MKVTDEESLSKTTLFVRGIPSTCSNDELSEIFSQAGPLKECFVVKYKSKGKEAKSDRPCIGYVTFTSQDDAKTALKMEKKLSVDGSALKLSYSLKKKFSKKGKKTKNVQGDTFEIVGKDEKIGGRESAEEVSTEPNAEDADEVYADTFTVLVCGLPALYKKEHALNLWKKSGLKEPLDIIIPCENTVEGQTLVKEEGEIPKEKKTDTTEGKALLQNAKFVVETRQSALKACNKLAGRTIGKKGNYTLKATLLNPEGNFKAARKSRLIVRNVSFQCSVDDLRKAFDLYGTITEVKIPTKPNGQKRGFAFVQFSHVFEAARAIQAMNSQAIKGRKVAIDWSLPKEKYKEMNLADNLGSTIKDGGDQITTKDQDGEDTKEGNENEDSEQDEDEEVDDEDDTETSDDSGMEEEDSEGSFDDEKEEEESDEEEENMYKKPLQKASKDTRKLDGKSSHDVHEGRTVFVMNLSYDTTEEQLSEVLETYGELVYTKIVMNHDTGMSKGCAFAQFLKLEDTEKCTSSLGEESSGIMLDGRPIKVVKALSRGDAESRSKAGKKQKVKEDKRNLYLGREGMIRPGTLAAEGLSMIELKKRQKFENAKRAKLRNPNIFISTTRLCVHNLPKSVDETKLREILLNKFKNKKKVRITECRIMRDLKITNEKGVGRSLGYAFVNFAKHDHALKALRDANNNPDVFGPIKRPIVEFALENKKALEVKEQRKRKFEAKRKLKEKMQTGIDGSEKENTKKVKKMGRRVRQERRERGDNGQNEEMVGKRPRLTNKNTSFKERKFQKPRNQDEKEEGFTPEDRKPFQGSSGTTLAGKKLPLPAHAGPKIRLKNRGKILEQMRKSKKLNSRAVQQKVNEQYQRKKGDKTSAQKQFEKTEKMNLENEKWGGSGRGKRKRREEDTEFDALVAKYTKAIMAKTPKTTLKSGSKWFEQ